MRVLNLIALVFILVVSASVTGADKIVTISIEKDLIPKSHPHEFPVSGGDEATLRDLLDTAVSEGLMTYVEDDVNGITSIDGNGDVIWMISGEGMNNLPTAEKLDYVPVDGQIIYFFAVVFETADEDADVIIAVTMAEFFITPKPALDKFPSHFRIFGVEGSTLQDLMDNAGSYDPPKMTYTFEHALFITSIDGMKAPDGFSWVVKGAGVNGWETLNDPIYTYIPAYGEFIQFSLEKDFDEHQQYSAGTRSWYSNMIVVTATLFAVYIHA